MAASSSCCLRKDIFNPDFANGPTFWHIFIKDEPDNHGGSHFWQLTLQWQTGDKFAFHVDGSHDNSSHSRHAILIPGHMHPFNIAGSWKIHEPVWRDTHTHRARRKTVCRNGGQLLTPWKDSPSFHIPLVSDRVWTRPFVVADHLLDATEACGDSQQANLLPVLTHLLMQTN